MTLTRELDAAVTTRADSRSGIWIGTAAGSDFTALVPESPAEPSGVSVDRDGQLVYAANTGQGRAIFVLRRGQPPTKIVDDAIAPVIAQDGRTLLFRGTAARNNGIWPVNVDGSDARRRVEGAIEHGPNLLPDGSAVIRHQRASRSPAAYPAPDWREPRVIAQGLLSARFAPLLSPDGRRVRFRLTDGRNHAPGGMRHARL